MENAWHPTAAEIVFAILLVVIPWGFSDMPVIWRCLMWAIAWGLLLHLGFVFIPHIGKWPIPVKLSISIGLSAFLVAGLYSPILSIWKEEKASVMEGTLVATETLPNVPPGNYAIEIGTVHVRFNFEATNLEPWIIGQRDKLRFDTDDSGHMLFSTVIRDRAGNVIVEIDKNAWRVAKEETQSWDKNFASDRLEVLDGRKVVVLQVKLFTNGVQLQGVWHQDNGDGLILAQLGPHGPQSTLFKFAAAQEAQMPEIPKAFEYPSKDHLGEQTY